ncbi:MAG: DNA mismatch repair protein [Halobacteriaceae archaeon]
MRLEDYWGVGPKTATLLETELGGEAAVAAIEASDVRALVDAGVPRGRATRILRRAHGGERLGLLATPDARAVYKDLLSLAAGHAVTRDAADRIRVLTPLPDVEAMAERLDDVADARASWTALDDADRETALALFERYDDRTDDDRAAADVAASLLDAGLDEGVFAPLSTLDAAALDEAATALGDLTADGVRDGADATLDGLRAARDDVADLAAAPGEVVDAVGAGARGTGEFREAFRRYVTDETAVDAADLAAAMPEEAHDAAAFVSETLRALADEYAARAAEHERAVREDREAAVERARADVDAARTAIERLAVEVSLARFADAYDLTRPTFAADGLAVEGARNLSLLASGTDVQPVTYAVGEHDLSAPTGDRVAVLTGANSGGKTTLLETLCQVSLLAQMGLPVPADRAVVGVVDSVVFHRRHASFNAGVLESTLRSVVPPLAESDRTLMLVDEFEAITEPGSAADLLHGLVTLTVDRGALGVYVTHLAADLEPLPGAARVDGIFAEGLDADLALLVDYQPRFGTVGRSTPEFIVSRLLARAEGGERAAYRALAEAVGHEAVQRTLDDARWAP